MKARAAVFTTRGLSERQLLLVIGAVQFVNVLDFMIVMPLGPDFSQQLHISHDWLGVVSGSYTAAAALSGIAGAFFLDRFPRRTALCVSLAGLVLGTLSAGLATGMGTMVLARCLAGLFGGPATSLAMSIIVDTIPAERRGKALGTVMGAFAIASVLGVPAGLELARWGGWQAAFYGVAALGALVLAMAYLLLPAYAANRAETSSVGLGFLGRPTALLSLSCTALVMVANFSVIPNLPAFLQFNLGYPRARLGWLYLFGGLTSFVAMRIAGTLADRFGSARVGAFGVAMFVMVLLGGFVAPVPLLSVVWLFVLFMLSSSFRMVPMHSLTTRVPAAAERARFLSAQSAVQHLASALGATGAATMLHERSDGGLIGMPKVALCALVLTLPLPWLMAAVERRLRTERQE